MRRAEGGVASLFQKWKPGRGARRVVAIANGLDRIITSNGRIDGERDQERCRKQLPFSSAGQKPGTVIDGYQKARGDEWEPIVTLGGEGVVGVNVERQHKSREQKVRIQ
jgi:hypothetical protein